MLDETDYGNKRIFLFTFFQRRPDEKVVLLPKSESAASYRK